MRFLGINNPGAIANLSTMPNGINFQKIENPSTATITINPGTSTLQDLRYEKFLVSGVFFDLDETASKTEDIHQRVLIMALLLYARADNLLSGEKRIQRKEMLFPITALNSHTGFQITPGKNADQMIDDFDTFLKENHSDCLWLKNSQYKAKFHDIFHKELRVKFYKESMHYFGGKDRLIHPDALRLLQKLKENNVLALLVTNTWGEIMKLLNGATEEFLSEYFVGAISTGKEGWENRPENPKPAGDPFILARRLLYNWHKDFYDQNSNTTLLYFDDSNTGVTSAAESIASGKNLIVPPENHKIIVPYRKPAEEMPNDLSKTIGKNADHIFVVESMDQIRVEQTRIRQQLQFMEKMSTIVAAAKSRHRRP